MSEWWCKDKVSPYDIRQVDRPLIAAAVTLGELILTYPEITDEQRKATTSILTFLRNLPDQAPLGLHGEFGFHFVADDETWDQGHYGWWSVSVIRGMFEIWCNGRRDLPKFAWELCPGHENQNRMDHLNDWIQQVSNPRALLLPGKRLEIVAGTFSVADS